MDIDVEMQCRWSFTPHGVDTVRFVCNRASDIACICFTADGSQM